MGSLSFYKQVYRERHNLSELNIPEKGNLVPRLSLGGVRGGCFSYIDFRQVLSRPIFNERLV